MRRFINSKISKKILIFGIIMIVASSALVASLTMLDSSNYFNRVSSERVDSALFDLQTNVNDMLEQSEKSAVSIAQNYIVVDALEKNDFNALKTALDKLNEILNMDTISVTDTNGDIIIRQHQPDKLGDNILSQTNVQNALKGETSTTIEPGALVKLSTRSGTPIYNQNGNIIGTVVTGFTFENSTILDDLKAFHNTEFTIFAGNERIATTIIKDGQRLVGTTLNDTITKIVVEDGQTYTGNADILGTPYLTKYEPLLDTNGKIVGAIFTGMSEANAKSATLNMLIHVIILVPVVVIVSTMIMFMFVNKNIKRPMHTLTQASAKVALGELDVSIDADLINKKDEIGTLANTFDLLVKNTRKQVDTIHKMAEGDLTVNVEKRSEKDILGKSLGILVDNLNRLASTIIRASNQVASGSDLVSNSSMALSQGATEQASAIQQLTASIEEIAYQTSKSAENAEKVDGISKSARANAAGGNERMKDMLIAMVEINDSSSKIGKIIKVIDDIAFQTNILALNAAVEAARAGQHGKGFAVVAEEVRALAAKSANAAKETTELIENSIRKVETGTKIANETADSLEKILLEVDKVAELVATIASATHEQASSIEQINVGVSQVSQVVQTNAATAEESAAASEELSAQAEQMKQSVNVFKINEVAPIDVIGLSPIASAELKKGLKTSDIIALDDSGYGKY